jgi:hypothetical protein
MGVIAGLLPPKKTMFFTPTAPESLDEMLMDVTIPLMM